MTAPESFTSRYNLLLSSWLDTQDEATLESAYALGKEAVSSDMSILDVAAAHIEGQRSVTLLGNMLEPFEEMLLQTLAGYELNRKAISNGTRQAAREGSPGDLLAMLTSVREELVRVRQAASELRDPAFLQDVGLAILEMFTNQISAMITGRRHALSHHPGEVSS